MTIGDGELEMLRSHFDDLRAEDAATMPAFVAAAPAETRRLVPRAWWLAIAAMVMIAATLVVLRERAAARAASMPVDLSILNWTPPTDGLLREARRLTGARPSVFGSILDGGGL